MYLKIRRISDRLCAVVSFTFIYNNQECSVLRIPYYQIERDLEEWVDECKRKYGGEDV